MISSISSTDSICTWWPPARVVNTACVNSDCLVFISVFTLLNPVSPNTKWIGHWIPCIKTSAWRWVKRNEDTVRKRLSVVHCISSLFAKVFTLRCKISKALAWFKSLTFWRASTILLIELGWRISFSFVAILLSIAFRNCWILLSSGSVSGPADSIQTNF